MMMIHSCITKPLKKKTKYAGNAAVATILRPKPTMVIVVSFFPIAPAAYANRLSQHHAVHVLMVSIVCSWKNDECPMQNSSESSSICSSALFGTCTIKANQETFLLRSFIVYSLSVADFSTRFVSRELPAKFLRNQVF